MIAINDSQISHFAHEGVVVLRDALSPQLVSECLTSWQWSVDHPGPLANELIPGSDGGWQDLCNPHALDAYRSLVADAPFADYAQALWQSDSVWFMYEQVFHKTGGDVGRTPWHQDTSYLAVGGAHLIAFWVSFETIPATQGLEFVRGSHLGPLYNTTRFDPSDETLPIFADASVPKLPAIEQDRSAWDIVSYDMNPGDVIAFHTSTLHGGGRVNQQTPERRTLTLRYFGDEVLSETRPGQAGPFYSEIKDLTAGEPFRHPRFLKVRWTDG
jgi:ectoine hydroxylase-related dioxygenase (phytanoyl-CoA dioxygenase family)